MCRNGQYREHGIKGLHGFGADYFRVDPGFAVPVDSSLGLAGVAQAGCMATVGLSPMPQPGIQAGQPWLVNVKVLQHGRTPLAGASPVVRIRSAAGRLIRFPARATATRGVYRA